MIAAFSDDFELDETWTRIKKAYDEGNAVLTLGTGSILPEEEQALGLVREHDYAVLDLKEEENSRLLLIKNPWVDSVVWTGVGSSATLKAHIVGSTSKSGSNQFWMAFEDVLQHFDSLYVNWNPALFTHRQDHHFKWDMPDKTEELVYTHNPQYRVLSPSGSPIWVLLSRHWQDGELDILRGRRAEKDRRDASLANVSKQLGFMAVGLFATSPPGARVPLPVDHRRLHQGPYVDSPNTLLRYNPTPHVPQTLVVTQSELPLPSYSFTLSFFSSSPLTISPAPEPLPHSITLTGAWTRRTAGGSAAYPTYSTNPQWSLTVSRPTPLSLVLSTDSRDLPVHVALLFSPGGGVAGAGAGARVTSPVRGRDIVAASPEYQRGCTAASVPASAPLDPGVYTIVASTFEPGQLAPFALRVSAASPDSIAALAPVPAEGAGMFRTPVPPPAPAAVGAAAAEGGDGGGGREEAANHDPGTRRMRAPVRVTRLSRLKALAMSGTATTTTAAAAAPTPGAAAAAAATGRAAAVRIALELGRGGPRRHVLAVSGEGEFADVSMGLRTAEVVVEPGVAERSGGLWVVLEQIGGGASPGVQVEVLSDVGVQVGPWQGDG